MNRKIDQLMRDLRRELESVYGPRLRGVYLYGSYARGEQDPESDVDVLIVLDDFQSYGAEVDRTSLVAAALSRTYGLSISKAFVREQEWHDDDTPFLNNVRREAIAA